MFNQIKLLKGAFITLCTATLLAACTAASVDKQHIGEDSYSNLDSFVLTTGDRLPSVTLNDSQGQQHNVSSLSDNQNILLVVYRGEWCPFCIGQLESFENVLPELKNYNTRLVAISPDSQATNKNTQRKFGLDYLFLSDAKMKLIDELGLRKNDKVPHPATILISKGGEVLWYYVDKDFKTRPTGEQMKAVLKQNLTK
ncbi:peroxiredoxin-like family protein [Catenovulum adriaticum]|uniref:thioredoxin-dependent peroxiredoxin n=1 Tax=Catenovulum adriaticum TaxID=2984846 RepID=A0ABY7AKY1_9ALTE|nr:peroxiredoxin-like family protein [Catenovulum sp. TS8]WAJ70207.1 AhpC/TSA family protein [Catenovulum sp. TS8]